MAGDDNNDNNELLYGYNPNKTLPIVAAALFGVLLIGHTFMTVRARIWKLWWAFVLGIVFEVAGYAIRRISAEPDHATVGDGLGVYIPSSLLIILAPALLAASMYMTFGRLVRFVDETPCPLRSTWITRIFVSCDVISFILQAAGGSMLSGTPSKSQLDAGKAILLFGFAVQIVAFAIFLLIAGLYHYRIVKGGEPELRWTQLLWGLYVAGIFILIRSIFRMAEFSQGDWSSSPIQQHEAYFYALECLPVLISVLVLLVCHPGRFLPGSPAARLHTMTAVNSDTEMAQPKY